MSSTCLPTQSSVKVTFLPNSFSSSGTTGLRLYFGLGFPSGRPRWDMRMTALAPLSMAYLIVGRAPTMRWLLVILSPSRGTLKSTCGEDQISIAWKLRDSGELTYADKHALALDVDVGDGELVGERHDGVIRELCRRGS